MPHLKSVLRTCNGHERFNDALAFIAKALTVLEASLALKTQGSLVKESMPFFAPGAAFFFNFKLSMPVSLELPFYYISAHATAMSASTTPFSRFAFKLFVSAIETRICICVAGAMFVCVVAAL